MPTFKLLQINNISLNSIGEREEQENILVGMWNRWQHQTTAKDDEISHNLSLDTVSGKSNLFL